MAHDEDRRFGEGRRAWCGNHRRGCSSRGRGRWDVLPLAKLDTVVDAPRTKPEPLNDSLPAVRMTKRRAPPSGMRAIRSRQPVSPMIARPTSGWFQIAVPEVDERVLTHARGRPALASFRALHHAFLDQCRPVELAAAIDEPGLRADGRGCRPGARLQRPTSSSPGSARSP